MSSFASVAESRIREALESGEHEKLTNHGLKLNLDDYFAAPRSLRAGFGILKSAGLVPPEVEAMRMVNLLREQISRCEDEAAKGGLRRELMMRETELTMALERVKRTFRTDLTD